MPEKTFIGEKSISIQIECQCQNEDGSFCLEKQQECLLYKPRNARRKGYYCLHGKYIWGIGQNNAHVCLYEAITAGWEVK